MAKVVLSAAIAVMVLFALPDGVNAQRICKRLVVLYEFNEGQGTTVADTSGCGDPMDLMIDNGDLKSGRIEWGCGLISINRGTSSDMADGTLAPMETDGPATKLYDAIVNPDTCGTQAFTVEAWVTPERDGTPGLELNSKPARIVSMSRDHGFRNFTLGQQGPGDRWVSRVRNSASGRNGIRGIGQMKTDPGTVEAEALTHVVLTRDAKGTETLYYNIKGRAFGDLFTRNVPSTLIDGGNGTTAGGNPGATDWHPVKWSIDFRREYLYTKSKTRTADRMHLDYRQG